MGLAFFDSPVGRLFLESQDNALISVSWMAEGLAESQPQPEPVLTDTARQLKAYFARRLTRFELPLRPRGSGFQQRVWGAIAAVPFGHTRTYGDLARVVGSAPRAVGQACGRNPIPIIIPCHRVVGSGGSLTGYSGADGVTTKQFLLRLEGVALL